MSNQTVYAIVGVLYLLALSVLFIFYKGDVVIAAGVLGLAFASVASFVQSAVNNVAIKATHEAIDGKVEVLVDTVKQLGDEKAKNAHAKGVAEGRAQMGDQQ